MGLCLEGTMWATPWQMTTTSSDGNEGDVEKGQDLERLWAASESNLYQAALTMTMKIKTLKQSLEL